MLKLYDQGLCFDALEPQYGQQAYGISPKGALDQLAFHCAKVLLGESEHGHVLEIIYPPKIEFTLDCLFVITGAAFEDAKLNDQGNYIQVTHGCVTYAKSGSFLTFGKKSYGFRSYLAVAVLTNDNYRRIGIKRGRFSDWFHWFKKYDPIRVIQGPESRILQRSDRFFSCSWRISHHSDNMGLRLEGENEVLANKVAPMISEAVADGTIQLTPTGPIVLLRHRQCTGGYPRIYNVISADIDRLSQFSPSESLQFQLVSLDKAFRLKHQKDKEFEAFKAHFSSI